MRLDTKVRSEDLFDLLGKEEEKKKDKKFRKRRARLETLIDIFESSCNEASVNLLGRFIREHDPTETDLLLYQTFLKNLTTDVNAKDINQFCRFYLTKKLDEAREDYSIPIFDVVSGLYLSALINKSSNIENIVNSDTNYGISYLGFRNNGKRIIADCNIDMNAGYEMESGVLDITDLHGSSGIPKSIRGLKGGKLIVRNRVIEYTKSGIIFGAAFGSNNWYIGEIEGGEIEVIGNVRRVGVEMIGGKITIHGSVEYDCGEFMRGGEIEVNGYVREYIGHKLRGGKICVKGSTYKIPGMEMKGGEIYLEGDYPRLPKSARGGNIYHKGQLVLDNGKKI